MTTTQPEPKQQQLENVTVDPTDTRMTTDQGIPVEDTDNSVTAGTRGPTLLEDFHFREKVMRFDHERTPERVVHARGLGAHGYFQPYDDSLRAYTAAPFLSDPSLRTPVFVRFSTVQGSRGSPDTPPEQGAVVELLALADTPVRTTDGDRLPVTRAITTVASVLYDAVAVPDGADAAATLSADRHAVHFVAEAYKHAKPVGVLGAGAQLLAQAQLPEAALQSQVGEAAGLVQQAGGGEAGDEFISAFVAALAAHRHYDRPVDAVAA